MDRYLRLLAVAGLAGLANVLVAALPGLWMPALGALDAGTVGVAFGVLSTATTVLHYGSLTLVAVAAGFYLATRADRPLHPAVVAGAFAVAGVASALAAKWVSYALSTVKPDPAVDPSWLATTVPLFVLSGLVGSTLARRSGGGDGKPGAGVRASSG